MFVSGITDRSVIMKISTAHSLDFCFFQCEVASDRNVTCHFLYTLFSLLKMLYLFFCVVEKDVLHLIKLF